MNYYDARQRRGQDGHPSDRWDYTCMNGKSIWPVGYCRAFQELPEWMLTTPAQEERHRSFAHKYHTDGHATEDEARECYRQYLLDQHLDLKGTSIGTQHQCVICGAWTQGYAEVNRQMFVLCDEHRTREEVEKLYGLPGYIISSY